MYFNQTEEYLLPNSLYFLISDSLRILNKLFKECNKSQFFIKEKKKEITHSTVEIFPNIISKIFPSKDLRKIA